jgi:hypothetical protein
MSESECSQNGYLVTIVTLFRMKVKVTEQLIIEQQNTLKQEQSEID